MTVKLLYRLLFSICFCGFSINANSQVNNLNNHLNVRGGNQFGLYIDCGQRQGMQYFDAANTEYNYRYYTITVTNDSTTSIHLNINFSRAEMGLRDTLKSKIFLLPRQLTPEEQHFDRGGMSNELKKFLDLEIGTPIQLNKTLKPTEKCVMTFGILTARKDLDPTTPFDTKRLTLIKNSSGLSVMLKINETLLIPCGQISYIN
jgi:hypothetical protein